MNIFIFYEVLKRAVCFCSILVQLLINFDKEIRWQLHFLLIGNWIDTLLICLKKAICTSNILISEAILKKAICSINILIAKAISIDELFNYSMEYPVPEGTF